MLNVFNADTEVNDIYFYLAEGSEVYLNNPISIP